MEKLIEELTKVNPSNLSEEGLKLFNKINEIIDRNGELAQENIASEEIINILTNKLDKVVEENNELKEKYQRWKDYAKEWERLMLEEEE